MEIDDRVIAPIELADAPLQEDLEEIQWLEPVPAASEDPPRPARPRPPAPAVATVEPILEAVAAEAAEAPPLRRPRTRKTTSRTYQASVASDAESSDIPGKIRVKTGSKVRWPVVWTAVALVVIMASTISYRLWRQRLQELPHEAEVNRSEGITALEKGFFDEAKAKLGRADRAYRTLGADDEVAQNTAQLAAEAAILADLAHDTLKDILEEVARQGDPSGIEHFRTIYKGQSILIDTTVASVDGDVVDLSYRIFVGRGPVPAKLARLDLSKFTLFEGDAKPQKGQRLLFGARLNTIRIENGEWLITLEPDSGVSMTNEKALLAAAMTPVSAGGAQ